MTQANREQAMINGFLFAVYNTRRADWYEQTTARQSIAYELAGEVLKAYTSKHTREV